MTSPDQEPSPSVDFAKIAMMHESLLKGSNEYEELFCDLVIILKNILTRYHTLREVGPEDVIGLEICQEAVDLKVGTLRSNLVQWISFFSRIPASIENKVNLATLLLVYTPRSLTT